MPSVNEAGRPGCTGGWSRACVGRVRRRLSPVSLQFSASFLLLALTWIRKNTIFILIYFEWRDTENQQRDS